MDYLGTLLIAFTTIIMFWIMVKNYKLLKKIKDQIQNEKILGKMRYRLNIFLMVFLFIGYCIYIVIYLYYQENALMLYIPSLVVISICVMYIFQEHIIHEVSNQTKRITTSLDSLVELMVYADEGITDTEEVTHKILNLVDGLDSVKRSFYITFSNPIEVIVNENNVQSESLNKYAESILKAWTKYKAKNNKSKYAYLSELIKEDTVLSNATFDDIDVEKSFIGASVNYEGRESACIIEKVSENPLSYKDAKYIYNIGVCAQLIYDKIILAQMHVENEKILNQVLDNIDSLIYVSDVETGEVLFANNAIKKIFDLENIEHKLCWEIFQKGATEPCEFCPLYKIKSINDPPVIWEEYNKLTKRFYMNTDQIIRWINNKVVHIHSGIDITDLKSTTNELVNKQKELENALEIAKQASKTKDDFLSKMSHELRTPLNAIIGMLEIAGKSDDIERIKGSVQKMKVASQNLVQNINDILDISKIEARKMKLESVKFNIEEMFRNILDIIEPAAYKKQINIDINMPNNQPSYFEGDEKRLKQVYINLLSNAVKFTEEGGKVSVSIKYEKAENGKIKLISNVTDTGIGIPKDKLSSVFQSFMQANNNLSGEHSGTGLGLTIAKNIVELMDGEISVTSEVGVGSTFSFYILLDAYKNQKEPQILADLFNILVIDEDEQTCEYLHSLFTTKSIKHKIARSGEEGINFIMQEQKSGDGFNVVLINYIMPDMDVIKIAEKFHNIIDVEIIIMISSIEWIEIADKCKELGITKFLSKPLLPSDVINAINGIFKKNVMEQAEEEEFDFSGKTILLFEDIEVNREIIQFILEGTEVECVEVSNGAEGLELYNKDPEKYDLILMDIQMPDIDGLEVTKYIRESNKKNSKTIPIIAMTANVLENQVKDALNAGMNSHLGKPIDGAEMKKEIAKYLSE